MTTAPTPPQYINYETGTKRPVSPTGALIDPHDPANWMSYTDAVATGLPVGFVLTDADPYFLLDLDKQRDPVTGLWSELAQRVSRVFSGAGQEISQSGNGIHVIGTCDQVALSDRRNKWDGCLEFYTRKRYIALGPGGITGDVGKDCTDLLLDFVPVRDVPLPVVSDESVAIDDDVLLGKMLGSRGSVAVQFGDKASVAQLWEADEEALSRFFPAYNGDDPFDRSSADAALMSHLAFWTGRNAAQMDRLFRRSGLMRDKYDRRTDYRDRTISGAVAACQSVYTPPDAGGAGGAGAAVVPGEYLTIDDQIKWFDGCVYIAQLNRILIPSGDMMDEGRFNATYGGKEFQMSGDGTRPSRKAWEAFTQNRAHRFAKVLHTRMTPHEPFGAIRDNAVNIMQLPVVTGTNEPVDRYLDLLARMIPDQRDRRIFLAWCAALVQSPGHKFQWAIVLQGAQGNGKSFLMQTLVNALGEDWCHLPTSQNLDEKFNSYIEGTLFVGVDEADDGGRRTVVDRLKRLISESRVEIRAMNQDQRMSSNYSNWMFATNHKNGVLKTPDDRRFAVFYTPQQTALDVRRDMPGDYFPSLWKWARDGGFTAITGYLLRYEVDPEFDPRGGCHRAPETSSTHEAVAQSLGRLEQEILEAVESELPGFRGGWISSHRLREYMLDRNVRVSPRVVREALSTLGYEPCALWADGRCGALVQEGNIRPRLYHTEAVVPNSVDDYIVAQGYAS